MLPDTANPLMDILRQREDATQDVVGKIIEAHKQPEGVRSMQKALSQLINTWGEGILYSLVDKIEHDFDAPPEKYSILFNIEDSLVRDGLFNYKKWIGGKMVDESFYAAAAHSAHERGEHERESLSARDFVVRARAFFPDIVLYSFAQAFTSAAAGSIFQKAIVEGMIDCAKISDATTAMIDRNPDFGTALYNQLAAREDIPRESRLWSLIDTKQTQNRHSMTVNGLEAKDCTL